MAVTVVIQRYKNDSVIEAKDVIPAGRSFEVRDAGYLYIWDGLETPVQDGIEARSAIAVYQPGAWASVFVGDARTPQKGDD